ncbi:MAG: D-glycerate dehydrogenase [Phycisphaeraceae bacterium]|nr:D-glycerate dehydrogenase [Phycisphaeraceae bacterium]MCB9847076.1 D-glycerate dehydrogenase [Phycisphaeraceae bacterium]
MPAADPPKVVVTRQTPGAYDTIAAMGADVVIGPDKGFPHQPDLHRFLREHAPIDVVVSMFHDEVNDAFLNAAGGRLRAVVNYAVGYDNIDTAACARRRVTVCNTPEATTEGTADIAWTLLLAAARRLPELDPFVRRGGWAEHGLMGMGDFLGLDIAGRTLHIIGAGRIGMAVALRSLGWGMRILYTSRRRHRDWENAPLNARRVDLEAGLREADFVSIHCPLTPETRHLINAQRLASMKPRTVLINTARGAIIDEAALVEALRSNTIYAAGLDVLENEPHPAPGLIDLPNVALTPHIGSGAARYREMMTEIVCENVAAILKGQTPPNPI